MYKIEHKLERRMKAHGISETMFTAPRFAVPFMTHSGPKNLPCAHTHIYFIYMILQPGEDVALKFLRANIHNYQINMELGKYIIVNGLLHSTVNQFIAI